MECCCFHLLLLMLWHPVAILNPAPSPTSQSQMKWSYFPILSSALPLQSTAAQTGINQWGRGRGPLALEISKLGKYLPCDSSLPWCMGAQMAVLVARSPRKYCTLLRLISLGSDGTQRLLKTTLEYPVPWFLPAVQRHGQGMGGGGFRQLLNFCTTNSISISVISTISAISVCFDIEIFQKINLN